MIDSAVERVRQRLNMSSTQRPQDIQAGITPLCAIKRTLETIGRLATISEG